MSQHDEASQPLVSVVVGTCNRNSIVDTLESLAGQVYPDFEVVLVDQSDTDATRRVAERFAGRLSRLQYVHVEQKGLSRAYNLGMRMAVGDIVMSTDDDCTVPADWLSTVARTFQLHPDIGLLFGQVLSPPRPAIGDQMEGIIPTMSIERPRILSREHDFHVHGMGANFGWRRSLFDLVGGFDEVLGAGGPLPASEDLDFTYRALRSGHRVLLTPDVLVYHHGLRSHEVWPVTMRNYGIGQGGFYWKHVRLGDAHAARLLLAHVARFAARILKRKVRLAPASTEWTYLTAILAGMRKSTSFAIDRRTRTYVARTEP